MKNQNPEKTFIGQYFPEKHLLKRSVQELLINLLIIHFQKPKNSVPPYSRKGNKKGVNKGGDG